MSEKSDHETLITELEAIIERKKKDQEQLTFHSPVIERNASVRAYSRNNIVKEKLEHIPSASGRCMSQNSRHGSASKMSVKSRGSRAQSR